MDMKHFGLHSMLLERTIKNVMLCICPPGNVEGLEASNLPETSKEVEGCHLQQKPGMEQMSSNLN
jgi:hypothetical protein